MSEIVDQRISNMDEQVALPRKNGELVFESPWEARAFGLAVALNEQGAYPWSNFSQGLAQEIAAAEAAQEPSAYYERWLATLENLVINAGLVTRAELDAMAAEQARLDHHEHDHDHDHDHEHHHHHHNGHNHSDTC
jgi:nitrile hydratase accessory protein